MGLYRTGMSSSGGGGTITVDDFLSTTSTNPVQNRIITNALNDKQDELTAGSGISISNNTISIDSGSMSGYQKFIDQDLLVPSTAGTNGQLIFHGVEGDSEKDLYRYDDASGSQSGQWVKLDFVSSHFTISTTDIGEGQPLAAGQFYIVVE